MSDGTQRQSNADRVKHELLSRIMDGRMAPGQRIVELQIANEMKTSQGPVREALRELEAMDLIITEPYKGTRVREITPKQVEDAYDVRAALERLAAVSAAKYFKGNVVTLRKQASAVESAARQKNQSAYGHHDVQFHRMIVAAANNRALLRSWEALAYEVRIATRLGKTHVDLLEAQAIHWQVIEALEKGNGAAAGRMLAANVVTAFHPHDSP
ncbi:GntR family transcriptional regulator [Terriglobus sp. RCC_193]|uniref:GntR family transcriptional regulator n=1 Tax=Terriglobus sp. RCC_193 TaxID=3239218 RepID=UPI003525A16F